MSDRVALNMADLRRAAALVAHFGHDSLEGVDAVLSEANDTGRQTELLFAVVSLYAEIMPELRTDLGLQMMSQHIVKLAGLEHKNE